MPENAPMTSPASIADGCVLAAVDASPHAVAVASLAGWAASRLASRLELVNAIDRATTGAGGDFSGTLSLGSQESLLAELAELDERRSRVAQSRARALLEDLQTRIRAAHGVNASIVQRHGDLVDTLLDLEPRVRLFVIGARGEHAGATAAHLGSNLERVVRAVHRPILVAAREARPIRGFLIAFDGSPTTRKCVQMVAASPLLRDCACHLLSVGNDDDSRRASLAWADGHLRQAGFAPQASIVRGDADSVIPAQVERCDVDLLVMGAYGHSRIRSLIVGSTTTQVLRTSKVPVLLLR